MSYQVLARKYRSQSFDEMIGQNHITQTLTNSLKNNRLPHALLFTGLRGTGKTSSARILAKALRCEKPVNFTPCNKCQSCIEISTGRAIDVIEIDGASNNGVDAIRDLRDNVMFMPSSGKYKIFIIDEVHMLSTSAFNALLKTLEEPPAHVIFILATTEVHKIPQTILSRCQRFDFRRIPLKQIADYLKKLCDLEKIEADKSALWLIARQGDGSMRDSLSLLDQAISFTNGHLSEQMVSQVLGLTERALVFEVFDCLLQRKSAEMVTCLEKLSQSGQNPNLFLEDLSKMLRHSLILKTDSSAVGMIDLPEDEITLLASKISDVSDSDLHLLFDMMMKALQDLHRAADAQIVFEIALLRMSQAPQIQDLKSLLAGENLPAPPAPKRVEELQAAPLAAAIAAPLQKAVQPETKSAVASKPVDIDADRWLAFVEKLKSTEAFFAAKIENLIFVGCKDLKISLQPPMNLAFLAEQLKNTEMRQKMQGLIDSEFGQGYNFEVLKGSADALGDTPQKLATKKQVIADEKMKEQWQLDPRVQKAKEIFKGEVKIMKKES
ncbi:MAG: DNA polymerase III subunit gamma/tau [Bdellovibrionaceae bacterium]|nr:DNA polymerase III subunit gamma/tau [Bdellovibrio sp.]